MISPEELRKYIETLRENGVYGRAKIGDIEIDVQPVVVLKDTKASVPRSAKAAYDELLFACTEGIREEEAAE